MCVLCVEVCEDFYSPHFAEQELRQISCHATSFVYLF